MARTSKQERGAAPAPEGGHPNHDIVVIGGSAGAVEVVSTIVQDLGPSLAAAVFLVIHRSSGVSVLPTILARLTEMPVVAASDGLAIERGRLYVAVPDFHLMVERDRMRVVRGPKQNGHRPAVDALFTSAASSYGARVLGVVLSGALDCGTHGLLSIKARGGLAVVQDPDDAQERGMPVSALQHVSVDHCVARNGIAKIIAKLVGTRAPVSVPPPPLAPEAIGKLAGFVCPECSGPLWQVDERGFIVFRCRVGHGYTAESLFGSKEQALEAALWAALNALSEKADLGRRLAKRARENGHHLSASRFAERASDAEQRAALVRDVLVSTLPLASPDKATKVHAGGDPVPSEEGD